MNSARWLALAGLVALVPISKSETVKDREGAVRLDRTTMENDARWIYNDVSKGFDEAKRKSKPLLVVLRCVPCLSCQGLDASVLTAPELVPLLDQFVCVRLINANAIDLSQFQFDYDLSLSALMFNADGTIYGRYGSWTHQKNPTEKTAVGFKRALEAGVALHQGYPGNKASLAGKQGSPSPFKTPIEIPELAGKYKRTLDWEGKVVQSCVHCHQIGDAWRAWYRDQGKPLPDELIYPMPMPETVGLKLEPDHMARVGSVAPGSIAAAAGIQEGDELTTVGGQPMISIADVSWVLHRAPASGLLPITLKRGGSEKAVSLTLPPDWRLHSDISRRVGTWTMRGMASGGMLLEDLSDDERQQRGIARDSLALFVKHLGEYGKHAAAKNAGFKAKDVIVELDGKTMRQTEGEVIGRLLRKTRPGDRIKATVLRGSERLELMLPIQ
jgi:hypothetical protein